MSWVKDNVFGGAAKDAAREQQDAFRDAQDMLRQSTQEARGTIMDMFPQAQQANQAGYGAAIDVFNQAMPQQMQMATQGNVNAQRALLAGLPQMNNALLGAPVDYSQLQAQQMQMPNLQFSVPNALRPEPYQAEQPAQQPQNPAINQPENIFRMIGAGNFGGGRGFSGGGGFNSPFQMR